MEREALIPLGTRIGNKELEKIFELHFSKRYAIERKNFGDIGMPDSELIGSVNTNSINVKPENLNGEKVLNFVKRVDADMAVIMGTFILKSNLLKLIPRNHVNIHLGLSPWYRGSGTLFWPTFNWEPWKTGTTFHRLNTEADAGGIIHQTTCCLNNNQGVHELAASAVIEAKRALPDVIRWMEKNPNDSGLKQPFVGRSYLSCQIRPEHLYDIYKLRNDRTNKILFEFGIKARSFKIYSKLSNLR